MILGTAYVVSASSSRKFLHEWRDTLREDNKIINRNNVRNTKIVTAANKQRITSLRKLLHFCFFFDKQEVNSCKTDSSWKECKFNERGTSLSKHLQLEPFHSKHLLFTSWYDVSHAMGYRVWGRNSIKNHSLTLLDN